MNSILKSIVISGLVAISQQIVFAQDADKTVAITVSGSGKTLEDAKQSALRSAIEQAFGAFISSKTEILDDQVISDQIASVSSGNIQSYSIQNEAQFPNGSWGVTLKAVVSVDKLTSFIEAKGIAIEIKGGMFALNIKQQLLNEQGEINAVSEMVGLLHEPMQTAFDYIIKSSDPQSLDPESRNWAIMLEVSATANKNMDFCANYCIKTLSSVSLSSEEVTSYESLKKPVFQVVINFKGILYTYNLRKEISIRALNTLIRNWNFYTHLFTVESDGVDKEYTIIDINKIIKTDKDQKSDRDAYEIAVRGQFVHAFSERLDIGDEFSPPNYDKTTIYFLSSGQKAATIKFRDKLTFEQIEQITGYKVKPRGVVSQYKFGGFVVYETPAYRIGVNMEAENSNVVSLPNPGDPAEKAGIKRGDKIISINNMQVVGGNISELINKSEKENKLCEFKIEREDSVLILDIYPAFNPVKYLIASLIEPNKMGFFAASDFCDNLIINGYGDWHLPSKPELNILYLYKKNNNVEVFYSKRYWSSTWIDKLTPSNGVWGQDFTNGKQGEYSGGCIPVRWAK